MDGVVSRGTRFLDFEIYPQSQPVQVKHQLKYGQPSMSKYPIVAVSSDLTNQTLSSKNTDQITLSTVLTHIGAAYGPHSTITPNSTDPLFLHLRIKIPKTANSDNSSKSFYDLVGNTIATSLDIPGNNLYNGPAITPETLMSSLTGKVIIIIDSKSAPNYMSSPTLLKYAHIVSGNTDLTQMTHNTLSNTKKTPPIIRGRTKNTTATGFKMVVPDAGNYYSANSNFIGSINKYGINIIPMKFYVQDNNLKNYELFFSNNRTAILSMADSLNYINTNSTKESFDTYTDTDTDTDIYLEPDTIIRRHVKTNKHTVLTENTICPYSCSGDIVPVNVGTDLSISTPISVSLEKTPVNFTPANSSLGGHIFIE